jgi:alpha-beta hydrolase superfamily lysophospholipase
MIMKTTHTHTTQAGNQIYLDHYAPDQPSHRAILYVHGFKGFKDWGFVPAAGEFFSQQGYHFIAFNFSHNGIGATQFEEFTQPTKFKLNTFSLEVAETQEMIEAITQGTIPGIAGITKLGIIGHSRGGGIALLAGSNHPQVNAICTWAAVSTFHRYSPAMIRLWKEQGYLEVANARTGQIFHLGRGLLTDLEVNGATALNIRKAVSECTQPLCILHGEADEAVPMEDARALCEWADQAAVEMHILPQAGHTFGIVHPYAGTTPAFDKVLAHTSQFFKNLG